MESSPPVMTLQKPIRFEPKLPIEDITPNPLNPRKVFREKDINDLCNSIIEMGGIIVPLVVFEPSPGQFILLDGERRFIAAKKLGLKYVPANVISGRLSETENLSTMFNIHMARESWDPASRALALGKLRQLYKGISLDRLAEITGMNKMALKDAERILGFPEDIVLRCLREGKPDYLRPSNLIEMGKAFEVIEQNLPSFFKEHDKDAVSRSLVKKIDNGVIPRNTDFRLVKTMFAYLPQDQVKHLIEQLLKDAEIGVADVYELVENKVSSKRFDLFRNSCKKFMTILDDFRFGAVDKKATLEAIDLLKNIGKTINEKLKLLLEQFS